MQANSISDWSQVIATIIAAVGVWLAYAELQKTTRWNKLSGNYTFFSNEIFTERELAVSASLQKLNVNLRDQKEPLSTNVVQTLLTSKDLYPSVKAFLNFLEDYSLAVQTGVLDEDASYALMADVVTRMFRVFEPLIVARRNAMGRSFYFEQFELLARSWGPRLLAQEQQRLKSQDEARKQFEKKLEDLLRESRTKVNTY